MTKNEILAIKDLPAEYVADGTQTCTFNGSVIAFNGKLCLPPIEWRIEWLNAATGKCVWAPIVFRSTPEVEDIKAWTGAEN